MSTLAVPAIPGLCLEFGAAETGGIEADGGTWRFRVAAQLLEGEAGDLVFGSPGAGREQWGQLRCLRGGGLVAGFGWARCGGAGSPEAAARSLYGDLLTGLGDYSLYRVWNFLPAINGSAGGLENYRAFNRGRWEAFAAHFGPGAMERHLPAASAVGTGGGVLGLLFLAGRDPVRHFENPQQVPAYRYPAEHGPRSPSFARGSVVTHPGGRRTGFLSGTSSILGHETVGADNLGLQVETTCNNVAEVLAAMGFAKPWGAAAWRVYLRSREDLPAVRNAFYRRFPEAAGCTQFVEADICRRSLRLEVEAVLRDG
jgi:hypothetical protein